MKLRGCILLIFGPFITAYPLFYMHEELVPAFTGQWWVEPYIASFGLVLILHVVSVVIGVVFLGAGIERKFG